MKILSLIILITAFSLNLSAQESIVGTFWTPDKDGKIKVFESKGKVYAKITWIEDVHSQKSKRPNGESTLGAILLKGFEKKKDNLWTDGYIVDPTKNKQYSAKLWLDENNNLVARGFVGISLLGKTVVFERVR